jgi:hypothetical protein
MFLLTHFRPGAVVLAAVLGGCTAPGPNHAELAGAIASSGNASIEWSKSGQNHFRVFWIDGKFVAAGQQHGVFPLTPGPHTIRIEGYFDHRGLMGVASIDAGEADVRMNAVAGARYEATGRVLGADYAEVWVADRNSEMDASDRQRMFLHNNPQGTNPMDGLFRLDQGFWLGLFVHDRKTALAALELLAIEDAVRRTYLSEAAQSADWVDAPGPTVLVSSHDLAAIKVAIVTHAAEDGFSVDAEMDKALQLSRPMPALRILAQAAMRGDKHGREFENFLFEDSAPGTRIYASRAEQVDVSKAGNDGDAAMNKRDFEALKELLDSVKRAIEKSK